jgi:hypothetical protein
MPGTPLASSNVRNGDIMCQKLALCAALLLSFPALKVRKLFRADAKKRSSCTRYSQTIFMVLTLASKKTDFGLRLAPRHAKDLPSLLCVLSEIFIASTFEPGATGANKQAMEDRRALYSNCPWPVRIMWGEGRFRPELT